MKNANTKYIIGITGGIACGKSYVTNILKEKKYQVIDTDSICHKLYEKDNLGYKAILKYFPEVFDGDFLNRNKLAQIVFNDNLKLKTLNSVMHPLILNEVKREIEKTNNRIIFLDVPLLFESGFDCLCDLVVVVYAKKDIQLSRLMKRNSFSKEEALKRIESQMSLDLKVKKAQFVIDNSDSFAKTNEQIDILLAKLMEVYDGKDI